MKLWSTAMKTLRQGTMSSFQLYSPLEMWSRRASISGPMLWRSWKTFLKTLKSLYSLPVTPVMPMWLLITSTPRASMFITVCSGKTAYRHQKACTWRICEWSTETYPKWCWWTMPHIPISTRWTMVSPLYPTTTANKISSWRPCRSTSNRFYSTRTSGR